MIKKVKIHPIRIYTLLALVFLSSACEDFFISEVKNVKFSGSESQLVVNSLISPQDTLIHVYVFASSPYMNPRPMNIKGRADVFIGKKGETLHKMTYSHDMGIFILDVSVLNPQPGNFYVLRVEAFDGRKADAECFIPEIKVTDIGFTNSVIKTDRDGFKYMDLEWRVQVENSTEEKYFRTFAYTVWQNVYYDYYGNRHVESHTSEIYLRSGSELFTDKKGDVYIFRGRKEFGFQIGDPQELTLKDTIYIEVLQTDRNYFLYHKSVENYFFYDDDFPFAEPVHIFSNVNGGLGVFGGFNKKVVIINP
jgi:hypothetical protein